MPTNNVKNHTYGSMLDEKFLHFTYFMIITHISKFILVDDRTDEKFQINFFCLVFIFLFYQIRVAFLKTCTENETHRRARIKLK